MIFDASKSAIIHGFQAFYYELLRQKERALSLYFAPVQEEAGIDPTRAGTEPTLEPEKEKNNVEGGVVEIQKKLLAIIENVSNTMLAKSRLNPKFIGDVKYIMAALTDEIFLNLRWEGAKYWRYTLLEKQLFQTELAGDKFFSMCDEIVMDFSNEEVAFVYLMALSLGFKGRYRDIENADEQIGWYKDRLHSMLNTNSARLFFPGRTHMIGSCYEYTYTGNDNTSLPDARFWSWCVISVIFLYVVISYCVWIGITGEISDVLQKISEQTRQSALI